MNIFHSILTVVLAVLFVVLCYLTYTQYQIEKNLPDDCDGPTCEKPQISAVVLFVLTLLTLGMFLTSAGFGVNTLKTCQKEREHKTNMHNLGWGNPTYSGVGRYEPAYGEYENNKQKY